MSNTIVINKLLTSVPAKIKLYFKMPSHKGWAYLAKYLRLGTKQRHNWDKQTWVGCVQTKYINTWKHLNFKSLSNLNSPYDSSISFKMFVCLPDRQSPAGLGELTEYVVLCFFLFH